MLRSSDAAAILASPLAAHHELAPVAQRLAADPLMTSDSANRLLAFVARERGLTQLELEMAHPDNVVTLPFAARSEAPADPFKAGVSKHLAALQAARH